VGDRSVRVRREWTMPLDDAERSVLAETERHLAHDDPALERLLRDGRGRRPSATRLAIVTTTLLLLVGLCFLELPVQAVVVLLLGVTVLVTTGWRPGDWMPVVPDRD
jgi:hypothetical protein